MAKCVSFRLTSEVTNHTITESTPYRVELTQPYALYMTQLVEQEDLCVCLQRVVLCQVDCGDEEFLFAFPEGDCFTILPAGTYEITIGEQYVHTIADGAMSIDLLFEPVDTPFIQSVIANGC